jgi:hypothetical protein
MLSEGVKWFVEGIQDLPFAVGFKDCLWACLLVVFVHVHCVCVCVCVLL